MPQRPLTGKQRRHLRALGHALDPVVIIGKDGVTDGVLQAIAIALGTHELIKVKVGQGAPEGRHDIAEVLADGTDSELVQVLGGAVLLYRADPEEPRIKLP